MRTYNTQSSESDGPFGAKWATEYSQHLRLFNDGSVGYRRADGSEIIFYHQPDGTFVSNSTEYETLSYDLAHTEYRITLTDGTMYAFASGGLLKRIERDGGQHQTHLMRDEDGLLIKILSPSQEELLVEMDGFGSNEGVVVMAATNRQDILDPALLRPGRFDRQIYVGYPDIKGREAILKVHARNKPLGDDVSLAELAKGTGGFTGADLENLMNEAALLSARKRHRFIGMAELNEAVIKVIAGPEKKSRVVIQRERKLTAYHEAGHAIVIHDLPTQDPVHEITIIPRGMAGGMTISLPQEDVTFQSRQQLTEHIAVCLGGRAAEQLALGDISTGAGNDLQRASSIARNMVTRYGMSDKLGNVVFDSGHDEVFIGRSMAQTKNYSEEVAALIDEEVKALIDGAYARCGEILTRRHRELDIVAEYLLQYENMDAKTFAQVFTDPEHLQPPAAYKAVEADAREESREIAEKEAEHGED